MAKNYTSLTAIYVGVSRSVWRVFYRWTKYGWCSNWRRMPKSRDHICINFRRIFQPRGRSNPNGRYFEDERELCWITCWRIDRRGWTVSNGIGRFVIFPMLTRINRILPVRCGELWASRRTFGQQGGRLFHSYIKASNNTRYYREFRLI